VPQLPLALNGLQHPLEYVLLTLTRPAVWAQPPAETLPPVLGFYHIKVSPLWCDNKTLAISKDVASQLIPLGDKRFCIQYSWSVTSRIDHAR
jgi:hypothetical protein